MGRSSIQPMKDHEHGCNPVRAIDTYQKPREVSDKI